MEDIYNIFLVKTIPGILKSEYSMPPIPFVFDENTINGFQKHLDSNDDIYYLIGSRSIEYLKDVRDKYLTGVDGDYIIVNDHSTFFSLLQEIIEVYSERLDRNLCDPRDFIRSIWLRMGVDDIKNVESFLRKQLTFLENDSMLKKYREMSKIDEDYVLEYRIDENNDWFETNQHITFSIRKNSTQENLFYLYLNPDDYDYDFPAIHFELLEKNGKPTCYIYGIQSLDESHSEDIKKRLQPVRKKLRNKYVSADFLIALGLFFDFLYDNNICDVEIPTLQVFNYPYHENLSSNTKSSFSGYSKEDKEELEKEYNEGNADDKILDYIHTKEMVNRFCDKQDSISYNKTERLIYTLYELSERSETIEVVSEPFIQSENMRIHLNGKIDLLSDIHNKKVTSSL